MAELLFCDLCHQSIAARDKLKRRGGTTLCSACAGSSLAIAPSRLRATIELFRRPGYFGRNVCIVVAFGVLLSMLDSSETIGGGFRGWLIEKAAPAAISAFAIAAGGFIFAFVVRVLAWPRPLPDRITRLRHAAGVVAGTAAALLSAFPSLSERAVAFVAWFLAAMSAMNDRSIGVARQAIQESDPQRSAASALGGASWARGGIGIRGWILAGASLLAAGAAIAWWSRPTRPPTGATVRVQLFQDGKLAREWFGKEERFLESGGIRFTDANTGRPVLLPSGQGLAVEQLERSH